MLEVGVLRFLAGGLKECNKYLFNHQREKVARQPVFYSIYTKTCNQLGIKLR